MSKLDEIRKKAEEDFKTFMVLVNPSHVYGDVHYEAAAWLTRPEAKDDQLLLLPRGHKKSHIIAVWCAWWITKHPDTTILYVSATEDLAISQLYAIKQILESDVYRRYWADMIHPDEAKREEWSARNIKVDHPFRKKMGVRDRTVAARSVGGNTTGLHCDVIVFDDIVVPDNAYTEEGRAKVAASYSQFSSIANAGAITKIVGTRYHGKDIYNTLMEMRKEVFDENNEIVGEEPVFEVFERQVETDGHFLWNREVHPKTGRAYGFDARSLASIRAKYFAAGERAQYYAQYYNNPNDPDSERVNSESFQYYEQKHLRYEDGQWYFKQKPLAVFCGADLAYTTGTKSDYTAFAVVGLCPEGFIYLLELHQFKTDKYSDYYNELFRLWDKWKFKKIRIETNAGANLVVEYIKQEVRKEGISLSVEGKNSRGDKVERTQAILEPRYESASVFHYRGGYMSVYEEQMLLARPAHDDLKDAVSAAIEISSPPNRRGLTVKRGAEIITDARFGGRIR